MAIETSDKRPDTRVQEHYSVLDRQDISIIVLHHTHRYIYINTLRLVYIIYYNNIIIDRTELQENLRFVRLLEASFISAGVATAQKSRWRVDDVWKSSKIRVFYIYMYNCICVRIFSMEFSRAFLFTGGCTLFTYKVQHNYNTLYSYTLIHISHVASHVYLRVKYPEKRSKRIVFTRCTIEFKLIDDRMRIVE